MADYKQIVRDALDRMSQGDENAFDPLVSEGYVCHDPLAGDLGLDGVKRQMAEWGEAFPEGGMSLHTVIGDGDLVAARWTARFKHLKAWLGAEPTGRWCTMEGISFYRFEDGKLVEEWDQFDALGLLRQIGAVELEVPSITRIAPEVQPLA